MNYLVPVLILLCCGFTSCLIYAMFSGRSSKSDKLLKQNMALREYLKEKEKALQEAREEAIRLNERIRFMEDGIRQRNEDIREIQSRVMRREQKIALLEKTVCEILRLPTRKKESTGSSANVAKKETTENNEEA